MRKIIKYCLFIGLGLTIFGLVFVGVAYKSNAFKQDELETNIYKITESFDSIEVDVKTSNVAIMITDEESHLSCRESEKRFFETEFVDNKLILTDVNEFKWYEKLISFDFKSPKAIIYINFSTLKNLNIETSTGNVTVGNEDKLLSIDNLDIKASTGNIELDNVNVTNDINIKASTGNVRLYDVKSENLDICVSTGNIKLSDVICANKIEVEASTGNIRLDRTDAYILDLTTSTGNIKGNLLTGKIFDVHVSTGSSKYPDSDLTKGLCKIHTSTGDVNISIYVPAE